MIDRDELEELFADGDIVTIPAGALPDGLADTAAREFLTGVGLPEAVGEAYEIDVRVSDGVGPVADVYAHHGDEAPAGIDDLYYLGFIGKGFLCVTGKTGAVVQVHEETGVHTLASDLERFVRVLAVAAAGVAEFEEEGGDPEEFFAGLRETTLEKLAELDPDAGAEAGWNQFFDDATGE